MKIAQYIILFLLIFGLFLGLYRDINGRPEKKPAGFQGVVASIGASALTFWLYLIAGTFSEIFK